jgi:hypothetical protein
LNGDSVDRLVNFDRSAVLRVVQFIISQRTVLIDVRKASHGICDEIPLINRKFLIRTLAEQLFPRRAPFRFSAIECLKD